MGEVYGYCRIVPGEAGSSEQAAVMREMQVEEAHIFVDMEAEEGSEHLKYRKLLTLLKPGDLLYIRNLRNCSKIIYDFLRHNDIVPFTMKIIFHNIYFG